jgi:DNA (cytosine-5)-methyltransferase 1
MQIIDIFSGIGGFSYAGAMMGWRTVQFCEMNMFCNKILGYYWPEVPIHTDIKTLTAEQIINNGLYDKNETTILTGGVPCQPWSLAGKRKGDEDDRNLWPQTIKLIGLLQPDYAVLENVPGFLNWNKGVFLEQILASLENEGYEVQPVILPACAVGAPHRRERIWFIAYSNELNGNLSGLYTGRVSQLEKARIFQDNIADTIGLGLRGQSYRSGKSRFINSQSPENYWENFPTQSPIRMRDDGISIGLDDITFPKWRNESLKALGNAIVPQIALELFKVIELINNNF